MNAKKTKSQLEAYQNKRAVTYLIGCIARDPQLVKTYSLTTDDFVTSFHQIIFTAINNMAIDGAKVVNGDDIQEYLEENNPLKLETFKKYNGVVYVDEAANASLVENVKYYYDIVKKWSLLRELAKNGIDVSDFFDPEDCEGPELQLKREKFENTTLSQMIEIYRNLLLTISKKFYNLDSLDNKKAGGEESLELKESWKKTPDYGFGFTSQYLTTITRGLLPQKMIILSAPSGTGKTRLSIANMCFAFAPYYWEWNEKPPRRDDGTTIRPVGPNSSTGHWRENKHGSGGSALYIGTEMDLRLEIEPVIWAYMADVPEDHIRSGQYAEGEEERVEQAIKYLRRYDENGKENNCGLYLVNLPEYNTSILRSVIEEYIAKYSIEAVYFDYIYSNPTLLAEFAALSKGKYSMRDDQALSYLSTKLKDLAYEKNIPIYTCTQVSGDYKRAENYDETIVRGARAIIDKCDVGMILTFATQGERDKLNEGGANRGKNTGLPAATHCLTVYKNRGGKYNKVRVWLSIDKDSMRVKDLYVSNNDYELLAIAKSYTYRQEGKNGEKGALISITGDSAKDAYKDHNISKETYDEIKAEEKEDPSIKFKVTPEDLKRLEKASENVNHDGFEEMYLKMENIDLSDTELDEDYDF